MKKFTDHGGKAWRPLARGKSGGCGERGRRSNGGEKFGKKGCFPPHGKNEVSFSRSVAPSWWRAAESRWKAFCGQTLRILSILLSYVLLVWKALPAWLNRDGWKSSSYLHPPVESATRDRAAERGTIQKSVAGHVTGKKLAKGAAAPGVVKGTSNASKVKASKRKTEKPQKESVQPKTCLEQTSNSSSSNRVPLAVEAGNTSQKPEEEWLTAVGRRGGNSLAKQRSLVLQGTHMQYPVSGKGSGRVLSGGVAAAAEVPKSNAVPSLAKPATTRGAFEQVDCTVTQDESSFFQRHKLFTPAVGDLAEAADDKAVPLPAEACKKPPASVSAATVPAAGENCSFKTVFSEDACPAGDALRTASYDEVNDGFTLATNRSRKPTARKPSTAFQYLNVAAVANIESAGKRGAGLQQSDGGYSVALEKSSSCFSGATSRNLLNVRPALTVRQDMCLSNNTTSQLTKKHMSPLQDKPGNTVDDGTDESHQDNVELPSATKDECLEKVEPAPRDFFSAPRAEVSRHSGEGAESLLKRQTANNSTKHLQVETATGQVKVETLTTGAKVSPPAKDTLLISREKKQVKRLPEVRQDAGFAGLTAAMSTSRHASATDKHAGPREQSFSIPEEEKAAACAGCLAGTKMQVDGEVKPEINEAHEEEQQPEQPKRWGDRLSDEDDDVCSWGSRESGEKRSSCFPFTQSSAMPLGSGSHQPSRTVLAARQTTTKTISRRRRGGFRPTGGVHTSTGEHGLFMRHERQRRTRYMSFISREPSNKHKMSRPGQRITESEAISLSPKGRAHLAVRPNTMQKVKTPEPVSHGEAEAATCWPSLSSAAHVKSGKFTAFANSATSSNFANFFEPVPRERGSFRPDSAPHNRRFQSQHVQWYAAPGEAAEEREKGASSRNAGTHGAAGRLQAGWIWRVRDQHQAPAGSEADSSGKSFAGARQVTKPFNGDSPKHKAPGVSQQEAASLTEKRESSVQTNTTAHVPMYEQGEDISTGCHEHVLHPAVAVRPEASATRFPEKPELLQGRARRRRAWYQRRRGSHYMPDEYCRTDYRAQTLQQQRSFYSYNVPPPPPPPPPPTMAIYSVPHTYPSTTAHAHEEYASQPLPAEVVAAGLLLPHPHEQQQSEQHQLMGPLHPYSDSSACYVPVAYSTPAALYEAQQQLEYSCTWVYPSATSVVPQGRSSEAEIERNHTLASGHSHCETEREATGPYEATGIRTAREHLYPSFETACKEPDEQDRWKQQDFQRGSRDSNNEEQPQDQHHEQQQTQRHWQDSQYREEQLQQQHQKQTCCDKNGGKETDRQGGGCVTAAHTLHACSSEDVNVLESAHIAEGGRISDQEGSESCGRDEELAEKHTIKVAVVEERASLVSDDGTPENTLQQDTMSQVMLQQERAGTSVNSESVRKDKAGVTPKNGTFTFLQHVQAIEKKEETSHTPQGLDNAASAALEAASQGKEKTLDYTAAALCPNTEQQNKPDKEEICGSVHSSPEDTKQQGQVCFLLDETTTHAERTEADLVKKRLTKCRQHPEPARGHKAYVYSSLNGYKVDERETYTKLASSSKTAEPEEKHSPQAAEEGTRSTYRQEKHMFPQRDLQSPGQQRIMNPDNTPMQSRDSGKEEKAFIPDKLNHKPAQQKEEKRSCPLQESRSVPPRNESKSPMNVVLQQSAQSRGEEKDIGDVYVSQKKEEQYVFWTNAFQQRLRQGEETIAGRSSQTSVQQERQTKSLCERPFEEFVVEDKQEASSTDKSSICRGPHDEWAVTQKGGGSAEQREREEDVIAMQQNEHETQQETGETRRSSRPATEKGKRRSTSFSTNKAAEAETQRYWSDGFISSQLQICGRPSTATKSHGHEDSSLVNTNGTDGGG